MATLGAELVSVAPGEVVLALAFRDDLTQQHGFLHAGAVASVVDSACGYAALSLMESGVGVLSVEFKVNMLAPAAGRRFRATGRVAKSGRTLMVCTGELHAVGDAGQPEDGGGTLIAMMQATMMVVRDRPGIAD